MPRFVLASRSPARLATLRAAGIEPEVILSDVDEEAIEAGIPEATPAELAQVLATAKAESVAQQVAKEVDSHALVVGCDSVFELDGIAYGKPGTAEVAMQRWRQMAGRTGTLHTGHSVIDTATGRRAEATASTAVTMGKPTAEEMADYLATGEPLEVAGGFTLDGLGGAFIERIDGDPSNVVGISLPTLRHLLAQIDVTWTDLWSANR